MIRKLFISSLFVLLAFGFTAVAQQRTVIKSNYAKKKLLGRHMFSLQWISWKYFGRAYVKQRRGVLYINGEQKGRKNDDYVKIDGVITKVNRYSFEFDGKVTTHVSHNNNGEPCVREGKMTFAIKKGRKYWRLQEMQSPCGTETDYVDIFMRR